MVKDIVEAVRSAEAENERREKMAVNSAKNTVDAAQAEAEVIINEAAAKAKAEADSVIIAAKAQCDALLDAAKAQAEKDCVALSEAAESNRENVIKLVTEELLK